eukprot:scaffold79944_cov60-Phaeocystis_antarctica.AAC.2
MCAHSAKVINGEGGRCGATACMERPRLVQTQCLGAPETLRMVRAAIHLYMFRLKWSSDDDERGGAGPPTPRTSIA